MSAPYFSAAIVRSEGALGLAYDAWVRHYNECAECQRDSWYEPNASQQAWFCHNGRALFRRWDNLTITSGRDHR